MIDKTERDLLKSALEKEKARIERALKGVADPDPHDVESVNWMPQFPKTSDDKGKASSTMEESADEVEEFDNRIEAEAALENRLHDVKRALNIIDTDRYGKCEMCGKEIPITRLRANPAARFDIEHSE